MGEYERHHANHDNDGLLHAGGHRDRLCLRAAGEPLVGGLLPRRPLARALGYGDERGGQRYVRLAAHGPARRRLLVRRRGRELDGDWPRRRHLRELAHYQQAPAPLQREGRQRHNPAGVLLQPLPRAGQGRHDHRRALHTYLLHGLRLELPRHLRQALLHALRL